eukprot:671156-Prymnesium_polylepis.1
MSRRGTLPAHKQGKGDVQVSTAFTLVSVRWAHLIRNSWHGVSAHSAPRHVSKLSTSTLDAAEQECQHMSTQYLRTRISVECDVYKGGVHANASVRARCGSSIKDLRHEGPNHTSGVGFGHG